MDLPSSFDPAVRLFIIENALRVENQYQVRAEHIALAVVNMYLEKLPEAHALPLSFNLEVSVSEKVATRVKTLLLAKGWIVEFGPEGGWRNVTVTPAPLGL